MWLYDRENTALPRWINLDNTTLKDTWTDTLVRLSCDPKWDVQQCQAHARRVLEALNRIYR